MKIINLSFLFSAIFYLVSANLMAADPVYLESSEEIEDDNTNVVKKSGLVRKITGSFLRRESKVVPKVAVDKEKESEKLNVIVSETNETKKKYTKKDLFTALKRKSLINKNIDFKKIQKILAIQPELLEATNKKGLTPSEEVARKGVLPGLAKALENIASWNATDLQALKKDLDKLITGNQESRGDGGGQSTLVRKI